MCVGWVPLGNGKWRDASLSTAFDGGVMARSQPVKFVLLAVQGGMLLRFRYKLRNKVAVATLRWP